MALKRDTELGSITLNDAVIARIIIRGIEKAEGKLIPASRKGKPLASGSRASVGDVTGHFTVEETEDGLMLSFCGIMLFGASIKKVTDAVTDAIHDELAELFPTRKVTVSLMIVGVKSKQIAERSIEVKKEYEAAR